MRYGTCSDLFHDILATCVPHFLTTSNRKKSLQVNVTAMEQLWTCPISLENPTCQNLRCISKYQLVKMGYGMSLVTFQPQFKIFNKIVKNLYK